MHVHLSKLEQSKQAGSDVHVIIIKRTLQILLGSHFTGAINMYVLPY